MAGRVPLLRGIALIGLSGAGKSTVAPLLAARVGGAWIDLDRSVEETSGRAVAALIESRGEAAFRDLECEALRHALEGAGGGGTGGGGGGMCMQGSFGIVAMPAGTHDHLPLTTGANSTMTLVMGINAGVDFTFTLPMENGHGHTIMFTAAECMTLRNGGSITGKLSSDDSNHTHTYNIECMT